MKVQKPKGKTTMFPFVPLPGCNAAEPEGPGECRIVDVTKEAKALGIRHAMGIAMGIYSELTATPGALHEFLRVMRGGIRLGEYGWQVQLPIVLGGDDPSPCWVVCSTCQEYGPVAAVLQEVDLFGEAVAKCLMQ